MKQASTLLDYFKTGFFSTVVSTVSVLGCGGFALTASSVFNSVTSIGGGVVAASVVASPFIILGGIALAAGAYSIYNFCKSFDNSKNPSIQTHEKAPKNNFNQPKPENDTCCINKTTPSVNGELSIIHEASDEDGTYITPTKLNDISSNLSQSNIEFEAKQSTMQKKGSPTTENILNTEPKTLSFERL